MQKANLDDSLILELDVIIRNNPDALLSDLKNLIKVIIKNNKWDKKMNPKNGCFDHDPWQQFKIHTLKAFCTFKHGDIMQAMTRMGLTDESIKV